MTKEKAQVLQTTRYPVGHPGGVERVAAALSLRLEARCGPVVTVSAFGSARGVARVPLVGDVVASLRFATRAMRGAGVVIVHGAEYAWAPIVAARLRSVRVVVVWHGVRVAEALPPAGSRWRRAGQAVFMWVESRLQRYSLRADATVVVSPAVRHELQSRYRFDGLVHVIPNGVDSPDNTEEGPALKRGTDGAGVPGTSGRPLSVIWVGTSAYQKGLDVALAAFKEEVVRHRALTLSVVGLRRAEASAQVSTDDDSRVRWYGCVPPSDVQKLLREHDVLLCPTRAEAFGMAVLEALAVGTPVVGSEVVGWLVGDAGLVITGYDPRGYAEALVRMLSADVREIMAKAARARALGFSWEQAAANYAAVIGALAQ